MTLKTSNITFSSRTHAGKRKKQNEDSILARSDIGLFMVADGMGGHQFDAQASRLAVDHILKYVEDHEKKLENAGESLSDIQQQILADAFQSAHLAIIEFGKNHAGTEIVGTTCTALWMLDGSSVICHIGDSILFAYKNGRLSKITKDHSMVQELVDIGRLTPEEAEKSPYANILSRVLGVEKKNEPDLLDVDLSDDEYILMCTDGLSKLAEEEKLAHIIQTHADQSMDKAADAMLNLALERGGSDNISLILIRLN